MKAEDLTRFTERVRTVALARLSELVVEGAAANGAVSLDRLASDVGNDIVVTLAADIRPECLKGGGL